MPHDIENAQIARLLREVAAALIITKANRFRIIAYDNAATAVESSPGQVKDLWEQNQLDTLPGLGKNISAYLAELFTTGHVAHFDKDKASVPKAVFPLLAIPDIGPVTAFQLVTGLGLTDDATVIADLYRATTENRIAALPGFGDKSQLDIRLNIEGFKHKQTTPRRMLYYQAEQIAQALSSYLLTCPAVSQVDGLGSLRRRLATIGDIDLSVVTQDTQAVNQHLTKYPEFGQIINQGDNQVYFRLTNGVEVNIRFAPPESYGSLLQHFTGSKSHNVKLREYANNLGLSLSEYGIKHADSQLELFASEKAFYSRLGLAWIPPEIRENNGEIEAALTHRLPKLVGPADIKGDLHLHSDFDTVTSHDLGANSLPEMAKQAQILGYAYLGLTEHNPASKLSDAEYTEKLTQKKQLVADYNRRRDPQAPYVFNGLEVDIRPDGTLAIPDKAYQLLDYLIVSIHSRLDMDYQSMTSRILTALHHPRVKILGHPTGRLIGKREGFEADWEKIFTLCSEKAITIEINGSPDRLDLPEHLVKIAISKGVKLCINSDAHSIEQMTNLRFGVYAAMRGWAEKSTVINTLTLPAISAILLANR